MREVIATNDGPKAIGPYSQAIKANGLVFLSGQMSARPGDATAHLGRRGRADRARAAKPRAAC